MSKKQEEVIDKTRAFYWKGAHELAIIDANLHTLIHYLPGKEDFQLVVFAAVEQKNRLSNLLINLEVDAAMNHPIWPIKARCGTYLTQIQETEHLIHSYYDKKKRLQWMPKQSLIIMYERFVLFRNALREYQESL
jgi:hypothetical protein